MDPNQIRGLAESIATQEDQAAESIAVESTPTGTYSKERVAGLVKAVNEFKTLLGDDSQLKVDMPDNIKNGPLPADLVNELIGINQAFTTYLAAEPEETDVVAPFNVKELTESGDLALVTRMLRNVTKDKQFAKFLRSTPTPAEPIPEPTGIAPEGEPVVTPPPNAMPSGLDPQVMSELDLLNSL